MASLAVKPRVWSEVKACLTLSIPLASAQLAQSMTAFADTVMMGWIGPQTLAAGGLASITFAALLITLTGIVSAVSPLVAEAYGAGRGDRIERITRQGLLLTLLLSLPMMLLLWHMDSILRLLGQEEANVVLADTYLKAILWGFFPALGFATLKSFVSALSQPQIIMVIMIGGTTLNILGNYILMFGKLGFPALGLAGIGWASTTAYWVMFGAIILYILSQENLRCYSIFRNLHRLERSLFYELLHMGSPIGILFAFETGLFTATTYLIGHFGTNALAAHQMILQTVAITFMVPLGISLATTVRVGQYLGRQNIEGARLAGYIGISLGALFMGCMALLFVSAPNLVLSLYLDINNPDNAPVVAIAAALLQVAALFQLFDGTQVIAGGALRGLKDTRVPMWIGIFAYWCVGLTSGYYMGFKLGLTGVGLWLGLAAGLAIAAIILTWRFYHLTQT
jgi:MATE family multidrug resistance protein